MKRVVFTYTDEQIQWIKANATEMVYADAVKLINEKFPELEMTPKKVKYFRNRFNCYSHTTGRFQKGNKPWNAGKHMKSSAPGFVAAQFKKGHVPHCKKPVGSVVKKYDGYWWVKLKDDYTDSHRGWKQIHRLIYELKYGEIPKGKVLVFLDGNPDNICFENLRLVSQGAVGMANKIGLTKDRDINNAIFSQGEIATMLKAKRKKKK